MKLLLAILMLSAVSAFSQEKNMIPAAKWSKKFYISDEFANTKGLQPGETNGLLRAWNGDSPKDGFTRVVDIRWYFKTPKEAEQYLKLNMPLLSESGDAVVEPVTIGQVSNLYIFTEGAGMRKLNESLGITNYMYFFLFTVKNYAAKVFVSTEKKIPLSQAAEFAKEAAKRLKLAAK